MNIVCYDCGIPTVFLELIAALVKCTQPMLSIQHNIVCFLNPSCDLLRTFEQINELSLR